MSMVRSVDVLVVGAGVQGLSAAYNIALAGRRSVAVLESHDGPGRESSGRSGSMLMKSRENAPKIALSLYSYDRFMAFKDEFGEPLHFRKTGFLSAVTEAVADRYEDEHRLRVAMGVPSERLEPKEVAKLLPGLYTEDLVCGVLGADDGEIDASQILRAYERAGRNLGVSYVFGNRVLNIMTRGDRIVGVRTTGGEVACEWLVNAAGAGAGEVASWVGLMLPILNRRRSLYIGYTDHPDFQAGPMVEDAEVEWYYRALGAHRVLMGMGLEPDAPPTDGPNLGYLPTVRAAARHRAPGLADFTIEGGSSGIRPLTPDILPIIGPVDGLDGYINSCGWGGEGIMHSPAGGSLVADWVNGTRICPIDPSPFLLERFPHWRTRVHNGE